MSISSSNTTSDSYTNTTISSGIDDLENPKYNYTGNLTEEGLRQGYGCQKWTGQNHQKYAGYFLYNNMHEKGFYFKNQENELTFFDGQFYNNKLTGYGKIINKDGSTFEGLFKDNFRFGPGVLTHLNDKQDVGLWNGKHLIRLSVSLSKGVVPQLCSTPPCKVKLLRYRKIVPVCPKKEDVAKNLMVKLGAEGRTLSKYPTLYNPHVRNEKSLFFDGRLYDLAQLGSEDNTIEVLEDEEAFSDILIPFEPSAEDELTLTYCECVNERCVHLNRQLDEIMQELKRISEVKTQYEQQLGRCKVCCSHKMADGRKDDQASSREDGDDDHQLLVPSDQKYSLDNYQSHQERSFSRDVVKKDLQQMMSERSSFVEDTSSGRRTTKPNNDGIDELYENRQIFNVTEPSLEELEEQQQQSIEDQQQQQQPFVYNYFCKCAEEEILDADYLTLELERLKEAEQFFTSVMDFLNGVIYKEFITMKRRSNNVSKSVKMNVEDLLAWNNEKLLIDILQHCFRYRNFEKNLSFSIKSLIIGDRTIFGDVGPQEKLCINFLKNCADDNKISEVRKELLTQHLHPDLADAKGNAGIHFAAATNSHKIIKELANMGANLNAMNDECLTPLILAILTYMSLTQNVTNWEKAFLKEIVLTSKELEEVTNWRPHESLVELLPDSGEISSKIQTNLLNSSRMSTVGSKINVDYLLATNYVDDYDKFKKAHHSHKKTSEASADVVERVQETILILLKYGADPNEGKLPMRPILLSIFSKNSKMVEALLRSGGNPNLKTEEGLNALHLIASLPFCRENLDILKVLLSNKGFCDLKMKTPSDYWLKENEELLGDYEVENNEDSSKTPVVMLAMRRDFDEENVSYQCEMVKMLIAEESSCISEKFLGHTLLSLAVLKGNLKLIRAVFPFVEKNQTLGFRMGNALTVLGLKRFTFNNVLPIKICKTIVDELVDSGMDVFDPIYEFANIFEFFANDYYGEKKEIYENLKHRTIIEKENLNFRKIVLNQNIETTKNCNNKLIVEYLKDVGRKILTKIYGFEALKYLIQNHFPQEDFHNRKCLENMARFLTVEEALKLIQLLAAKKQMEVDEETKENLLKILKLIQEVGTTKKKKKSKQKITTIALEDELEKILQEENLKKVPYVEYISESNFGKYQVCFHCLKKTNKILIRCPCCQVVQFCSKLCNKFNKKIPSKHRCKIKFYDKIKEESNKIIDPVDVNESKFNKEKRKKTASQENVKKRRNSPTKSVSAISSRFSEEEPLEVYVFEEKKLNNCGFYCGQEKPNIEIGDDGKIIREREFCVCYPLYKEEAESQSYKLSFFKLDEREEMKRKEMEFMNDFMIFLMRQEEKRRVELEEQEEEEILEEEERINKVSIVSEELTLKKKGIKRLKNNIVSSISDTELLISSGRKKQHQKGRKSLRESKSEKTYRSKKSLIGHALNEQIFEATTKDLKKKIKSLSDIDEIEKLTRETSEGITIESRKESSKSLDEEKKAKSEELKYKSKTQDEKITHQEHYKKKTASAKRSNEESDEAKVEKKKVKKQLNTKDIKRDKKNKDGEMSESTIELKEKSKKRDDEGKRKKKEKKNQGEAKVEEMNDNKRSARSEDVNKKHKKKKEEEATSMKSKETQEKRMKSEEKLQSKKIKENKAETNRSKEKVEEEKRKKIEKSRMKPKAEKRSQKGSEGDKKTPGKFKNEEKNTELGIAKKSQRIVKEKTEEKEKSKKKLKKKEESLEGVSSIREKLSGKSKINKSKREYEEKISEKSSVKKILKAKRVQKTEKNIITHKEKNKFKKKDNESIGIDEKLKKEKRSKNEKLIDKKKDLDEKLKKEKRSKNEKLIDKKKDIDEKLKKEKRSKNEKLIDKKKVEKSNYKEKKKLSINQTMKNIKLIKETTNKGKDEIKTERPTDFINKKEKRLTNYNKIDNISLEEAAITMKELKMSLLHPETLLAMKTDDEGKFKRISRIYQYFIELLSKYFPDFDLSCLLMPFACFMDGQLYYKFSESAPFYCRTYSTM